LSARKSRQVCKDRSQRESPVSLCFCERASKRRRRCDNGYHSSSRRPRFSSPSSEQRRLVKGPDRWFARLCRSRSGLAMQGRPVWRRTRSGLVGTWRQRRHMRVRFRCSIRPESFPLRSVLSARRGRPACKGRPERPGTPARQGHPGRTGRRRSPS